MSRLRKAAVAATVGCILVGVLGSGTANAVVGGTDATEGYPWIVQITQDYGPHVVKGDVRSMGGNCTGSLIGAKWVLTAAHCVKVLDIDEQGALSYNPKAPDLDKDKVTLRVGSTSRYSGGEVPAVERIVSEPDGHDIALIELAEPVAATPIALAASVPGDVSRTSRVTATPEQGPAVRMLGWGTTCRDASCTADTLQELDTTLGFGFSCSRDFHRICTETTRAAGPDHGDSGGPLVAKVGDHWEQYGVTQQISGADKAVADTDPVTGVYGDVSAFRTWIDQTIAASAQSRPLAVCIELDEGTSCY